MTPPRSIAITVPLMTGRAAQLARIPIMTLMIENTTTGSRTATCDVVADVVQEFDRKSLSLVVSAVIADPTRPPGEQPKIGYTINLEDVAHAILNAIAPVAASQATQEYRTRAENEAAIQVAIGVLGLGSSN